MEALSKLELAGYSPDWEEAFRQELPSGLQVTLGKTNEAATHLFMVHAPMATKGKIEDDAKLKEWSAFIVGTRAMISVGTEAFKDENIVPSYDERELTVTQGEETLRVELAKHYEDVQLRVKPEQVKPPEKKKVEEEPSSIPYYAIVAGVALVVFAALSAAYDHGLFANITGTKT